MHPESFLSNFRGACHLEVTLFSCLLASSRRPFRALKMRPVRQEAVLRASENASRTIGACFLHRMSLPYRRSLFFTPNASENASRTTGSLFWHRISLPYRRSLFLRTECLFRTVEACFLHRMLLKMRRVPSCIPDNYLTS